MGPDGRIYWEVGDIGLDVTDKSGKRWSYPNQGAVMRSEPDGSNFEVFATGIRNLQEFSFDEYGNLISVDNDGDHQGETERVVYIPNGSDSGWRSNWQYGKYTDAKNNRYNVWMDESMFKPRFAGQAAHIVPPVAAYHSGPSGMVYNPGTALADEWKNYFFVSSFPGAAAGARIYGFKLKEDGAGFALEDDKVVLRGILTVGVKFGPDGALYLADWITGWDSKNKGRIWKLDSPAAAANPMRTEVRTLIAAPFATRSAAELATMLRHVDMRIRQKAQFELVRRGNVQTARSRRPAARTRRTSWRASTASGASRSWRAPAKDGAKHAALLTPLLKDADAEIRAQAAKMLGDLRYARGGAEPRSAARRQRAARRGSSPPKRSAASPTSRRRRRSSRCSPPTTTRTSTSGTPAASRSRASATRRRSPRCRQHPSRGVRIAAIVALRRLRSAEVARFVTDSDERSCSRPRARSTTMGRSRRRCRRWRALLDDKRFGERAARAPRDQREPEGRLGRGASNGSPRLPAMRPVRRRMRVEAVAAMGVWPDPSPMDRVDGIYLGQAKPRDAAAAQAALLRLMQASAMENAPAMKVALAEAAGRLGVQGAAPVLLAQLRERHVVQRARGGAAARSRRSKCRTWTR